MSSLPIIDESLPIIDVSKCEDTFATPVKDRRSSANTKEEEWLQRPVPHPSARVLPFTKREGETKITRTEQEIDDWLMEPTSFVSPMEQRHQLKRQQEAIVLQCEEEIRDIEKKTALIRAEIAENQKNIAKNKQIIHNLLTEFST